MKNWFIPSVEDQALVLDRLAEFYFSWVDSFVELISEMTWEISFKELRSTILYLLEFWYVQRSYTWKWNEFFVKITKKWITYYEKIFESEGKLEKKESFLDKIKRFSEWINAVKWIATWAVAVLTIFWWYFHQEIWNQFSADVFHESAVENNFSEKEAIEFLKNRFSKDLNFSCRKNKNNEFFCNITIKKVNLNKLSNSKLQNNKKILLKKDLNWKIKIVR